MIIFDLDGTLANCEHRRHFVDRIAHIRKPDTEDTIFKSNWTAFYEACDKDEPIQPVINIFEYLGEADEYGSDTPWVDYSNIQIWSGRCESVRKKTEKWLSKHIRNYPRDCVLKMRPIGDNTPDDILKERWLDEFIAQGKTIDFVFDDRPKVVRMWRRRGIFVFNCAQTDREF